MKFISKMSNLRIVLRPGMQAQPITGTPAVPALFVQFRDGVAEVQDEKLIGLMLDHSALGRDFIKVADEEEDPYKNQRTPTEPDHVISEIENGRVQGRNRPPAAQNKDMQNAINEQAKKIAMAMLPELLKSFKEQESGVGEKAKTSDIPEEITEEKSTTTESKSKPKKTAAKKK